MSCLKLDMIMLFTFGCVMQSVQYLFSTISNMHQMSSFDSESDVQYEYSLNEVHLVHSYNARPIDAITANSQPHHLLLDR